PPKLTTHGARPRRPLRSRRSRCRRHGADRDDGQVRSDEERDADDAVSHGGRLVALGGLLVLLVGIPQRAAANGDPASDVLYSANVYLPYDVPSGSAERALKHAVDSVYARHFRVKVAVIAAQDDLGSVPSLWGHP